MTASADAPRPAGFAGGGFAGWWERYWFDEGNLCRLGAFRMVIMAAAFYAAWHKSFGVFQHADGIDAGYLHRVWNPIYAFQLLGLAPPGPETARAVYAVLVTSIALSFVGLFTRVSLAVTAVLSFYWIGTAYSFGKPHHDCISLMLAMAILPFSPAGARMSLDSLVARVRAARRGGSLERPRTAPFAALPLKLTIVTGAGSYFFAGASKLAIGGLGWMNGFTLQGIMLEYRSDWSGALTDDVWLLRFMSAGLLLVQVAFPIVLFSKRSHWFFVPVGLSFHLMAMKTMATGTFLTLWFTLAAFIALERVPDVLEAGLRRGSLLRRALFATAFCAATYGLLLLYMEHKSPWLLLIVAAPLLSVVYLCLDGLRLELVAGPRGGVAAAVVRSLDWGRRVRLRSDEDEPEQGEGVSFTRLAGRLPLLVPLVPVIWGLETSGVLGESGLRERPRGA